ncbi:hypothetical protein ACLB1S_05885 [Escherichia coli]
MIALVALFRPGPLQSGMVDNFIDRKHGREEISYPDVQWQHESLKPVLEPTYGIILYQEQVIQELPGAFWLYPRWRGYAWSVRWVRKSRKRWLSSVLYLLKVQKRTESTPNWR